MCNTRILEGSVEGLDSDPYLNGKVVFISLDHGCSYQESPQITLKTFSSPGQRQEDFKHISRSVSDDIVVI
jgi:hypothetical protein